MLTTCPDLLCAVDFSGRSRLALLHAAALSDHFKARLRVLIAAPEREVAGQGFRVETWLRHFVNDALRDGGVRLSPELLVRGGAPGKAILQASAERRTDLIVISSHGDGVPRGACGSTTAHVLAHASTPVLVVPSRLEPPPAVQAERLLGSARVILAPVSFHSRSVHDARIAAGLAEAFGLPLLLLHVVRAGAPMNAIDARTALQVIADALRVRIPLEILVTHGEAALEIGRVAMIRRAGAVVMGLTGDPRAPGSPPGSIAYPVLCHAPVLVIALPAAADQPGVEVPEHPATRIVGSGLVAEETPHEREGGSTRHPDAVHADATAE